MPEEAFEEPKATELGRLRGQRRQNHRQITYDCLEALVGDGHRVTCPHAPGSMALLAVLRGNRWPAVTGVPATGTMDEKNDGGERMNACAVCGREASASERVCPRCQPAIPRSLLEACGECGEGGYRAGLVDGTQIPFDWAIISGNWVTLGRDGGYDSSSHGHSFPRGVEIRLATIVWCARDPDGLEQAEPAA